MDENLLKYFTGNGEPTTEEIIPQNIKLTSVPCKRIALNKSMSVENKYYIRYGATYSTSNPNNNYSAIEVYTTDTLDNSQALYIFDNLKINNDLLLILELKRDENGRFYGVGYSINPNSSVKDYFIIFNNFVQDGYLKINKYYTLEQMGIPSTDSIVNVIKKTGSGDYYFLSSGDFIGGVLGGKIFHFKIDINAGNTLTTYSYQYAEGSFSRESFDGEVVNDLSIIEDNIVFLHYAKKMDVNAPYPQEYHKLVVNSGTNPDEIQQTQIISKDTIQYADTSTCEIEEFLFKNVILTPNGSNYNIKIHIIDLDGNTKIINCTQNTNTTLQTTRLSKNYLLLPNGTTSQTTYITFHYFDYINNSNTVKFYEGDFNGYFTNLVVLKKYNLVSFVGYGGSGGTILSYAKNIFSQGYSSTPYYNNNFLIPQYINLYGNANDNTSVIFSRDVSNRFLAGNQLTATFNVPNYMLNNAPIQREDIVGQTNQTIESDIIQYTKNRFESLYLSYIYNMYITDNTNSNNELNTAGANRLANSVWNALDYQNSPLAKARITYEDGLQDILNLNITNISGNTCTFEYEVSGDINKIEYLSNDEETVYATYRCNLTGTNTISQTITIEEG